MGIKKRGLVYGIGINDSDYVTQIKEKYLDNSGSKRSRMVWTCPYYSVWVGMLRRCYNEPFLLKNPSYRGTTVCDEWLTFSNFKVWMQGHDWKGKQLDKDILGDGKTYSPEFCAFIPAALNAFLTDHRSARGEFPIGVSLHSCGKFQAKCRDPFTGGQGYIGLFDTAELAHEAWKNRKHVLSCKWAEREVDVRVKLQLLKRFL